MPMLNHLKCKTPAQLGTSAGVIARLEGRVEMINIANPIPWQRFPAMSVANLLALDRASLELFVEVAIHLLDQMDGDVDLEDADQDEEHCGREHEEGARLVYGIDQTKLPILTGEVRI